MFKSSSGQSVIIFRMCIDQMILSQKRHVPTLSTLEYAYFRCTRTKTHVGE